MNELEIIDETLSKLVDHFESQGKVFMVAWQYVENPGEDIAHAHGNFMSTDCSAFDRTCAIIKWASQVEKSMEESINPPANSGE